MSQKRWIRLWGEFLSDEDMLLMGEVHAYRYLKLMSLMGSEGEDLDEQTRILQLGDAKIAKRMHIPLEQWCETKQILSQGDDARIAIGDDGSIKIKGWWKWQRKWDTSTYRVHKHRGKDEKVEP